MIAGIRRQRRKRYLVLVWPVPTLLGDQSSIGAHTPAPSCVGQYFAAAQVVCNLYGYGGVVTPVLVTNADGSAPGTN